MEQIPFKSTVKLNWWGKYQELVILFLTVVGLISGLVGFYPITLLSVFILFFWLFHQ